MPNATREPTTSDDAQPVARAGVVEPRDVGALIASERNWRAITHKAIADIFRVEERLVLVRRKSGRRRRALRQAHTTIVRLLHEKEVLTERIAQLEARLVEPPF